MPHELPTRRLSSEISELLASALSVRDLRDLLEEAISCGMLSNTVKKERYKSWPLLTLLVCETISGRYEQALPAAAALQLFKAAAEVLDDVEDADSPDSLASRYGIALATNAATTLIMLAEEALGRLQSAGVPDHLVIRIINTVNSYYTVACTGQHLDLRATPDMATEEAWYLRVAAMKSATSIECACHIGALLATTNQELIGVLTRFGHNVGMASQIANDILGVTQKLYESTGKVRLPSVYTPSDDNRSDYRQSESSSTQYAYPEDNKGIKTRLFNNGAIHYATVKMEYYRQQARDDLLEVERRGIDTEQLKSFVE